METNVANNKPRVVNDLTEVEHTMCARAYRIPDPLTVGGQEMEQVVFDLDLSGFAATVCAVCNKGDVFQQAPPWFGVLHEGQFRYICEGCYGQRYKGGIGPLLPSAP
jgi:hypothetical protein